MSAFGEIARRISSLPQCGVDIILSFASNELQADRNRPLAIQTYVVFNMHAEQAAAKIFWLQARSEAWWQAGWHRVPIGRHVPCKCCERGLSDQSWSTILFADIPIHRTHEALPHAIEVFFLIRAHRRQSRHRVCQCCHQVTQFTEIDELRYGDWS